MTQVIPRSIGTALTSLKLMERELASAKTHQAIRRVIDYAKAAKVLFREVREVREQADNTILAAEHRIGEELRRAPINRGGGDHRRSQKGGAPILAEQVGSQTRGLQLKKLADYGMDVIWDTAAKLHRAGKDASRAAVLKVLRGEEKKERREASRAALPVANGMDLRIGDCRQVLADIAPNSITLILTDPPYGAEAEPLYRWLAEFAARVLIPGAAR